MYFSRPKPDIDEQAWNQAGEVERWRDGEMVSWKEARVEHGLTFKVSGGKVQKKISSLQELSSVSATAYCAVNCGQEGIYFPEKEIRC